MTRNVARQTLYYDDGSMQELTFKAPTSYIPGTFVYTLYDQHTQEYYRPDWGYSVPRSLVLDKDKLDNTKGYPGMVPLKPRIGVKLTERLQWFWVKQLVLSMYGIELVEQMRGGFLITFEMEFNNRLNQVQRDAVKHAWGGLTRDDTAFTNGRGTSSRNNLHPPCRDYIRKTNLSAEYPILWENTCIGNTLMVNSNVVPPDAEWIEVKTLRTTSYDTWKNWTYKSHPHFFTLATNSTPYLVGTSNTVSIKGPWKVDPMHFLGGKDVPVPLISEKGFVYVERNRVKVLGTISEYPRVYNP